MATTYNEIHEMVCRIPKGRIATYGQIARLINRPRAARLVGYALAALDNDSQVPWHRVVNSRGEISSRVTGGYEKRQRTLLEDEGVTFDKDGRINLPRNLWHQPVGDGFEDWLEVPPK